MLSLSFEDMDEAYWWVYQNVCDHGDTFVHRGATCREIRPFSFTLNDPARGLFTGAPRRMNYRFWAAECLGYLAGYGSYMGARYAELLVKLNSNYANFRDPYTGLLNPMVRYGDGFINLPKIYDVLLENYDRRQAYLSIWSHDTKYSYEESPCMTGCQFFTEQLNPDTCGRSLSMYAHMRSNDLNWGVPYDVASNCAILCTMAAALGMPIGRYHHCATSMHFYEDGSMGERPPNIHDPGEEGWITDPPKIPTANLYDMTCAQSYARIIFQHMHRHFVTGGKKGADFVIGLEQDVPWVR